MLGAEVAAKIREQMRKAIVGQDTAIDYVIAALYADGHVLLESPPGLAKTLIVRTLAKAVSADFCRIQFTPDLMPSDVIGTNIFDPKTADFKLRKGPIFSQIILADEINRTPPKTQAALLEAMEERQATIDGVRLVLPFPFLVFATQNPIEFEGTYPLPEAQQDRFMMKIPLHYLQDEDEIAVLAKHHRGFRSQHLDAAGIEPVLTMDQLKAVREECDAVAVDEKILRYIYEIVSATRASRDILVGGSPRAGIALLACSKALAAMRDRNFVIPDDVKELAIPVLGHRVILRPEAEIEGLRVEQVLSTLIDHQQVPR
jgi:MoxR-like ATPase